MTGQETARRADAHAKSGEDADLFASGNAPTAPSGMDAFPDLGELDVLNPENAF